MVCLQTRNASTMLLEIEGLKNFDESPRIQSDEKNKESNNSLQIAGFQRLASSRNFITFSLVIRTCSS